MSRFISLPFGQADCFLLELQEKSSSPKYILFDGGRKETCYPPLMEYLHKMGITSLDLMLLTHFHSDHLGWLDETAHFLSVAEAVLPYGNLGLSPEELEKEQADDELCRMVRDYERLIENLNTQGTRIHTVFQGLTGSSMPRTKSFSFSFGSYTLKEVFPAAVSREATAFEQFCLLSGKYCTAKRKEAWSQTAGTLNGDSSVWLLYHGKKAIALFCGDIFESSLKNALDNICFRESIPLIKLSHHGRNDKGHVYFTPDFINSLKPETIVITNIDENRRLYGNQWKELENPCHIYITGSLTRNASDILVIDLPE